MTGFTKPYSQSALCHATIFSEYCTYLGSKLECHPYVVSCSHNGASDLDVLTDQCKRINKTLHLRRWCCHTQ